MSPMVRLPLTLEHALLGFVVDQPLHAYDIHRTLTQHAALGRIWRLKQGQLYALLTKLEAAGYLSAELETQANRPPRRLLTLTALGREAFERWRVAPVDHGRDFRQDFLAKLYFASRAPDHAVITQLLATQRQATHERLAVLRAQHAGADREPYDALVLRFRIGQLEHVLTWLEECALVLDR